MSAPKRTDLLGILQKVLAKHYKPYKATERPVLEQLLYACCLEDSRPEVADESFARLQESFFDWNEVRVTTVRELSELLRGLHDPTRSATMIKQNLHSVFEAIYEFDLESLHKQNLGAAEKQLQQFRGTTPFSVAFVVQNTLAGHSIPVSRAGYEILAILGLISDKELKQQVVPGLERSISNNKGPEFGSLLQQFAADFAAGPNSQAVRSILLEIDPEAKTRLPKRTVAKKTDEVVGKAATPPIAADKADKSDRTDRSSKVDKSERSEKPEAVDKKKPPTKAGAKPPVSKEPDKREPDKREPDKREPDKREPDKKGPEPKAADKKKPAGVNKKKTPTVHASDKKKSSKKTSKPIAKKASQGAKKSTSKQLARRKPR